MKVVGVPMGVPMKKSGHDHVCMMLTSLAGLKMADAK